MQQRTQLPAVPVRSGWGKGANNLNVTEIKASLVGNHLSNMENIQTASEDEKGVDKGSKTSRHVTDGVLCSSRSETLRCKDVKKF